MVWNILIWEYILFVFYYLMPLLQLRVLPGYRDQSLINEFIWKVIFFHIFFILILYCYFKTMLTTPGTIPEEGFATDSLIDKSIHSDTLIEKKQSGGLRNCKWCMKYKPDRTHHCRVCKSCVLMMDHHCPWVFNCVGFYNHKPFMLLLLYTVILVNWVAFVTATPINTVTESHSGEPIFILIILMIASSTIAVVVSLFFLFHCYLTFKQMTTIEFCEQSRSGRLQNYSEGWYKNMCHTFGPNPMLWFVPINNVSGDGMSFRQQPQEVSILSSTRL